MGIARSQVPKCEGPGAPGCYDADSKDARIADALVVIEAG